jgi:hypothetical protein
VSSPVELRIDRVVVDGVPLSRHEAALLHAALERRLARELRAAPTVPGGALARLEAPPMQVPRDAGVDAVAGRLAGSIGAGLRGGAHT